MPWLSERAPQGQSRTKIRDQDQCGDIADFRQQLRRHPWHLARSAVQDRPSSIHIQRNSFLLPRSFSYVKKRQRTEAARLLLLFAHWESPQGGCGHHTYTLQRGGGLRTLRGWATNAPWVHNFQGDRILLVSLLQVKPQGVLEEPVAYTPNLSARKAVQIKRGSSYDNLFLPS